MRRTRFFCLAMTMALLMTLGSAALAEYSHPSNTYGFTLPEGWYPITHATVEIFVEQGVLDLSIKERWFDMAEGESVTMLQETGLVTNLFKNYIVVNLSDAGVVITAQYYASFYEDDYEAGVKSVHPKADIITPLQVATFGGHEAVVSAFSFPGPDGNQYANMDVMLFFGTKVAILKVVCTAEAAVRCGAALEEIAVSFFMP